MQEHLESSQAKYKGRHDKHRVDHHFQVSDQFWLHISKDQLQCEGGKLNPIGYGPSTILDQVVNSDFRLDLPPYMQNYFIVNVEKLKLYEPHMIVDQHVQVQVPYVDEFAPKYLNELQEDVILDKKVRYS